MMWMMLPRCLPRNQATPSPFPAVPKAPLQVHVNRTNPKTKATRRVYQRRRLRWVRFWTTATRQEYTKMENQKRARLQPAKRLRRIVFWTTGTSRCLPVREVPSPPGLGRNKDQEVGGRKAPSACSGTRLLSSWMPRRTRRRKASRLQFSATWGTLGRSTFW